MMLGKVMGSVVATIKDKNLMGLKLLIVASVNANGKATGEQIVAADTVGAGPGDRVLVVTGSSARLTAGTVESAVDAAIVAIVDRLDIE
ncbi:MAG: EutN/CcmL family microcompartment protein [Dehalococcoidales bacterium]|nr:EutN/CcmL family microcompartment protein [Dehalococcoidales bacterium]